MEAKKITIKKTATYHTFGDPQKAKHVIFALHGYGQLTQFFIRKFHKLSGNYFIVAPEGLHRFYLQGSSGRVGASWMTKEKREDDIHDYVNYLNNVWSVFSEKYKFESRILLGFSQGGATASRWHQLGQYNATKFILWGAIFPPDLKQNWENEFKTTTNYFVVGNEDPYYSEEKIETQEKYFTEKNVNFTTVIFNGKHEIEPITLLKLCQ